MALNRCEFIGHLGADPEVRRMQTGDPVVNLRVAVSERWTDRSSGEKRERTTWVPVVIFNEHLAKVAEQYLHKGSKVFVAGQFHVRSYDRDGEKRYVTEIVLNRFRGELQMLDSKDDRRGNGREYERQSQGDPAGQMPDLDDEIPF